MATASVSREASSKSEAFVQRKFAELCTRVQRVELLSGVLTLGLIIVGYACLIGWFDYLVGATSATRWIGFTAFVGVFAFFCVQTIRMGFRRVNPYYVAHQLEHHLPESKNSLINWLDLHDDALPSAFQKNLSARAAEQLKDAKPEVAIRQRKHWVLLGITSAPLLALFVLFVLGPAAFFTSMLQAFAPFYTPAITTRTQITLLEPAHGDAEVNAGEAMTFAVRIDGRPDAPKLHYRYQPSEDYLTLPLQRDTDGKWTTQFTPTQLRSGLSYKITAGDAETPTHQITVRGRLHVAKFEAVYHYRPYRQLTPTPVAFKGKPLIVGTRGTEVELIARANRPVQSATIEMHTNGVKKSLPARLHGDDKRTFTCTWTLEQNAEFRVVFNGADSEANADREWYPIDVRTDAAPIVVLTSPGMDITLPENGTLMLEGRANDDVGIKQLALHLRVAEEPSLTPIPYELGEDTPKDIDYFEVVALDQLKNAKGTTIRLRAGLTIEYWLEAIDNADYPDPKGNIGKSPVYKILLTPAAKDDKVGQELRDKANTKKKEHVKNQEDQRAQKKNDGQANPKGHKDPEKDANALAKENDATQQKIEDALNKEKNGATKSADPKSGESKGTPPPEAVSQAQAKSQPPMSPGDTGHSKDKGEGKSPSGEAKNDGDESKKPKDNADNKGDRKNGSANNPSAAKGDGPTKMDEGPGASKDAGMMGMDTPPQSQPKTDMGDAEAPMANAKGSTPPSNEPQHGESKGAEQNGPPIADKSKQSDANPPPEGMAKSGKMNDAGDAKGEPKQGEGDPGQARDSEPRGDSRNPDLRDVAMMVEQIAKDDANADKVGAKLADLAKNADDPRVKELAKDILDKNGRDEKTGQIKKGPNRFGSKGTSDGISDEVKTTIANREFAARIGQMQLDDWKKRLTPDLLKRAGLTDADWQRFLKNREAHDALVRKLNAALIRENVKELRGNASMRPGVGPTAVQSVGPSGERLGSGNTSAPPELIEAERRLFNRPKTP